jgi:hypothetical protein
VADIVGSRDDAHQMNWCCIQHPRIGIVPEISSPVWSPCEPIDHEAEAPIRFLEHLPAKSGCCPSVDIPTEPSHMMELIYEVITSRSRYIPVNQGARLTLRLMTAAPHYPRLISEFS